MHPAIITCAITGAETTTNDQPALPIHPKTQATAAAEAVAAGASIIHLHVREDDGKPSQRVERFQEVITAIRSACKKAALGGENVIIQISTGGAVGEVIEKRAAPLQLKPEMASLNLGTMNFGNEVFWNAPDDIISLADKMATNGVMPELEIYEVGMLESAFRLFKKSKLKEPMHFQFVLGVPGGMGGEAANLLFLIQRLEALTVEYGLRQKPHWGVAGVGRYQLPLATVALVLGGHVRVGFEDNIYYRKGELAKSNAQLVDRIVRIANECERKIANPKNARELLGLKTI